MNLRFPSFLCVTAAFASLSSLFSQSASLVDFDQWVFPEFSWKEEDFQNRFLGRYGVNGYTEPQMDVENFNVYEGAMALIENKSEAVTISKRASNRSTNRAFKPVPPSILYWPASYTN